MNTSTLGAKPPELNVFLQKCALFSLLGLIVLCVLWETWLAPLRPGGTLLFMKALPLAFAVRGVARGSLYTIQWASMLVLLYLMEGVVRVMSDPPGPSIALAWVEIFLAVVFFMSAIFYVRPAKQVAKLAKKQFADSQKSTMAQTPLAGGSDLDTLDLKAGQLESAKAHTKPDSNQSTEPQPRKKSSP